MIATSHYKVHVWTGEGRIVTESGVRENIESGADLSRPFLASPGWLRRHENVLEFLPTLEEFEASKRKPEPTPAKVEAVAEEKPKAKPKRTRKAKPKTSE